MEFKTGNWVIITHIRRTGRTQFSWQSSERWGEILIGEEETREILRGKAVIIDGRIFIPSENLMFNNDLCTREWIPVEWNKEKKHVFIPGIGGISFFGNIDPDTFERRF